VQIKLAKLALDPKFPNLFFFRNENKANLLNIRAEVGKELTRRINEPYFEDFKVLFAPAAAPSDNQRAYYFGVVLPTIQEYFKSQGNYMSISELDENIRGAIAEEFGLIREETNLITGEVEKRRFTLSSAGNKKEVAKYIDAVILWAARDYNIEIPLLENNL
jgi:hypothetical protein